MDEILPILIAPFLEFLKAAATSEHAAMLAGTWAFVEVTTPLAEGIVMLPLFARRGWRLALYGAMRRGKQFAAMLWCSAIVWIPGMEPTLCDPEAPADGCQSIGMRLALGSVLGLGLALGHRFVFKKALDKIRGDKRYRVRCANCDERFVAADLSQACPKCGQPPHEVTGNAVALAPEPPEAS